MPAILDQNSQRTGMYHEPEFTFGIWTGRKGDWCHQMTVRLVPAEAATYSSFDSVKLAHAFLLKHFTAPGTYTVVKRH
jgi:hypothetical protein